MDELCDIFRDHIPSHETYLLNMSSNMTLSVLSESKHLLNSNQRYKKYLKHIDFSKHDEKGVVIVYMLNKYLEHVKTYSLEESDPWLVNLTNLASQCKIIDKLILDLL
jgi:hypothetical protein